MSYIKNKRLGFQKEHVVIMPLPNYLARQGYPPYKSKLVQDGRIMAVTTSTALPGSRLIPLEPVRSEGMPETERVVIPTLAVDYAFLETMGLELVAGRSFSQEFPTDEPSAFILNEAAVQRFGWPSAEAAVGKQFQWLAFEGKKGRVIGVVRDFHLKSLHHPIEPVVIHLSRYCRYILVRIRSEDIPGTLAFLKQQWLDVRPNFPFEYTFLDEEFDQLHRADQRVGQLVGSFALLAILIACLGLFGLASFSTQQRTKEIGIRKVLGASVTSIVMLLSKEFTKLVVVAILIAWPVAYVVMNRWLQDFAYRITISRETFLLAGGLALVIAWLTVSVQAIKVALANPVEALRYE